MAKPRGYRVESLAASRLGMAAAQELAGRRHLIYALVEADLTWPLALLADHRERTGERLSLTGYVVSCVARALAEHPDLNAFRLGRSLILLDEVIVVVLMERRVGDRSAIGYLPIRRADTKSLVEITAEIQAAKSAAPVTTRGERIVGRLPQWLATAILKRLTRSISWALRYGTAGVNNVGFGADVSGWGLSPGAGTLAVTIGGISSRHGLHGTQGRVAHLTLAFDHDVVDGGPASRFTSRLLDLLASGETTGLAPRPPKPV